MAKVAILSSNLQILGCIYQIMSKKQPTTKILKSKQKLSIRLFACKTNPAMTVFTAKSPFKVSLGSSGSEH